jgi:type II secretory pathway pseudopilin PulG
MIPTTTVPRMLRFRLRSLLVVIALVGLLLAVILQTVRLEQAASREARLRAELRSTVDQLFTQVANQSAGGGTPSAEMRRELLERSLKFYQGMETKASSPEARTKALERVRQIRSKLGDELDKGKE